MVITKTVYTWIVASPIHSVHFSGKYLLAECVTFLLDHNVTPAFSAEQLEVLVSFFGKYRSHV
jgi:hypothetical protein